ncbi:hypothetical protein X759_10685 [Mesorhizobium sp. LSHC420B00]|nr:hypothetical protein X759_10685 [Mesorhizobium sp. LSHC420B00]
MNERTRLKRLSWRSFKLPFAHRPESTLAEIRTKTLPPRCVRLADVGAGSIFVAAYLLV